MLTWWIRWEMMGPGLPTIRVRARTFNEALKKARLFDPGYNSGYALDED